MFDIGATELLLVVIIAVVVIGPKDLPAALRAAGRWMGKIRRVSGHFRAGVDAMIREAEMEDMEKKWAEQNARIMAKYPPEDSQDTASTHPAASAEARAVEDTNAPPAPPPADDEPQLPLPSRPPR
ncbi:Sec-independent protein translocase protein TatB [Leptolyngbya sp. 15MV]|nr:Sec-independent protein translocase protein TatB [Leptolyngbya sp. 15MV]